MVNHATDPNARHHRYHRHELGPVFGFVNESSGERRTVLGHYFVDDVLVHGFAGED